MEIEAQKIIDNLSNMIKNYVQQIAVLQAQVEALQAKINMKEDDHVTS